MRKIETKGEHDKRNRRNQWIIGIVLVVVLLGSTFGIIIDSFGKGSGSNKISYNNIEFDKTDTGYWEATTNGFGLFFTYNPKETESISLNPANPSLNKITSYYSKPLYIYSENPEAGAEIYRNLNPQQNAIVERVQEACPQDKVCQNKELPVKDCTNNFIIIENSNETGEGISSIIQNGNCVFIKSSGDNAVKASDEFLFRIFSIK